VAAIGLLVASAKNVSIQAEWLCRSGSTAAEPQRHLIRRLLHTRHHLTALHSISSAEHCLRVSSHSVGGQFHTITVAWWTTVTIRRTGFNGDAVASGLLCDA